MSLILADEIQTEIKSECTTDEILLQFLQDTYMYM